ncbi:MAG: hypothetical protein JW854_15095 [Actinobacteria bacterium]|nr:hypothetical protein [Actinomycetota bacterium]
MVAKLFRLRVLLPVILLALLLSFSLQIAVAQELGEEGEFALQEEYRMEINEVGDAHITDTITYDPLWFDEYGYLFEENENLLSRRYRADSNVGEVENFEADIDSGDATITISFDTPGLAYNLADGWTIFGYGNYEVLDEGDDEVILQAAWTITNEFSLFEPMSLAEEVVIVLPPGARNAVFDETTGAIEYDLAYAEQEAGFLEDNKTLLIIIFALVMAVSLILLLYAFTRPTKAPAVIGAAGAPAPVQAPPPATAPTTAPTQTAEPAGAPTQADGPRFCKKCGHPRGTPDERFCRKCGAALE